MLVSISLLYNITTLCSKLSTTVNNLHTTNTTNCGGCARCPRGQRVTPDGKGCEDRNECLDNPCANGGTCINRNNAERYTCFCPSGYTGANCELMQEEQILRLSMGALAAILVCLLIILGTHYTYHKKLAVIS